MSLADRNEGSDFKLHLGCRLCLPELALKGAHNGSLCCCCIMPSTLPLSSSRLMSMGLLLCMLLHLSSVLVLGTVKALLHTRPVLMTAALLPL